MFLILAACAFGAKKYQPVCPDYSCPTITSRAIFLGVATAIRRTRTAPPSTRRAVARSFGRGHALSANPNAARGEEQPRPEARDEQRRGHQREQEPGLKAAPYNAHGPGREPELLPEVRGEEAVEPVRAGP